MYFAATTVPVVVYKNWTQVIRMELAVSVFFSSELPSLAEVAGAPNWWTLSQVPMSVVKRSLRNPVFVFLVSVVGKPPNICSGPQAKT